MAVAPIKRRRLEDEVRRPKKRPKVKRQVDYHSSSEEESDSHPERTIHHPIKEAKDSAVPKSILKANGPSLQPETDISASRPRDEADNVDDLERNTAINAVQGAESDEEEEIARVQGEGDHGPHSEESEDDDETEDSDLESQATSATSSNAVKVARKRNDPAAFATSIDKILSTKLTQSKRQDPILSRSKESASTNQSLNDSKLDQKARALLRAEKKQSLEKGRVKDVLGLETPNVDTGAILEEEKRLKKTAQRGVVRLFNAVRAAQVKAEEGMRQAKEEGLVGMQKRGERVNEMSKQGFLDLISQGGKRVGAEG